MNTVIYLSGEEVRAVVCRRNGRKLVVDAIYREKAPDGSIVNGQVMQEREFTEFLKYFWEKHGLSRRKVTLVIGSARAVTRTIVIPKMSHRRIMEYLPREFASIERAKAPVYTYHIFQEQGKKLRILASMVERGFLEQHIRRFEGLGISVCSVFVGIVENLKWLSQLPQIQGKTCVVQILDGRNLFSILFVRGSYYYFTNTKIFRDRGTPAFGSEIDLALSVIRQFLRTQIGGEVITHVFLGAGFQKEDLEICRESIGHTEKMPEVLMLNQDSPCLTEIPEISKVFGVQDRSSLLYQYRCSSEVVCRRREFFFCLAPAAALAGFLIMAAAFQGVVWFSLSSRVDRLMEQADNLEMIEQAAAYDRLAAEDEMLTSRLASVGQGLDHIHSYPVYTSRVRERLETCGGEAVTVQIDHYDGALGAVSVYVTAANAADIAPFIERLEMETDLFGSVSYKGFQYDSREQVWKSHVICYLAAPVTEDETTEDETAEAETAGSREVSP